MKSASTGNSRKVLSIVLSLLIAVQTPAIAGELAVDEEIAVSEAQTAEETTAQEVISTEETSGDVVIEEEVPGEAVFEEEVPVDIAEEVVIPEETAEEVIPEEVTEEAIPEEITLDGELLEVEPVEDSLIPEDIFEEELVEEPIETITEELAAEEIDADSSEDEEIIEEDEPALVGATKSGECGNNAYWKFSDDGVLTISGTGDMWNFNDSSVPWSNWSSKITTVVIGQSIKSIGNDAFASSSVSKVSIGGRVKRIGDSAFFNTSLKEVNIPDSVTSIGDDAFGNCNVLGKVKFGNSVTSIGDGAFYCCNLYSLKIPGSVTNIGNSAFSSNEFIMHLTIPDSVTSIGDYAFANCIDLYTVEIGNGVTSIGESAFYWCSSLWSVTLGNNVTNIGYGAFDHCNLRSVTFPRSVKSIGEYAFFGNYNLNTFYFKGNAPRFDSAFISEATIYYPADNPTWTKDIMDKMGYDITWKPFKPLAGKVTANNYVRYASTTPQSFYIDATCLGSGKLTYSINSSYVTVDSTGKVTIPAYYNGKPTITINAAASEIYYAASKKITVTVKRRAGNINANNFTKTSMTNAQSFSIGATRLGNGKLTYSINSSKVTVDENGTVTIPANYSGIVTITIKAAASGIYDETTKKIKVTINPRQPAISSLSNSSAGKMTVQWKRVLGSTGYRVQFSTDKTFKTGVRSQMITPNNTLSRVISGLTKGKTYYVHMRTYKTVGDTTLYSKWSDVKTLKITK